MFLHDMLKDKTLLGRGGSITDAMASMNTWVNTWALEGHKQPLGLAHPQLSSLCPAGTGTAGAQPGAGLSWAIFIN